MSFANTVRSLAVALAALVAFASPARAEWLRAETEHFVIVGDTSRGEISEYARKVERFDALLRMFLPPTNDDVIPPDLIAHTAVWLPEHSELSGRVYPGLTHSVSEDELLDVRTFLGKWLERIAD